MALAWRPLGHGAACRTLAWAEAFVAPRMAAAASGLNADPLAGAVTVAVALVPPGALLVVHVHAPLVPAHGLGAQAHGPAAALVGSTTSVTDSWFALFASPLADHRDVQRHLAHGALRPSHAREQGRQPATQDCHAGQLECPTPRDGAGSQPLGHLVEAVDDLPLSVANFLAIFGGHRLLPSWCSPVAVQPLPYLITGSIYAGFWLAQPLFTEARRETVRKGV